MDSLGGNDMGLLLLEGTMSDDCYKDAKRPPLSIPGTCVVIITVLTGERHLLSSPTEAHLLRFQSSAGKVTAITFRSYILLNGGGQDRGQKTEEDLHCIHL